MGNSLEIFRRHYASMVPEAMRADVNFGLNSNIESTGLLA
jgi:hypothetical protein